MYTSRDFLYIFAKSKTFYLYLPPTSVKNFIKHVFYSNTYALPLALNVTHKRCVFIRSYKASQNWYFFFMFTPIIYFYIRFLKLFISFKIKTKTFLKEIHFTNYVKLLCIHQNKSF